MTEPSLQLGGGNWANKSDKLLGYHKDGANFYADELTFSRNSLGSYTDANGLVQSMPYNLLTYSEQFDNAAWSKADVTVTANTTISPDGTQNADVVTEGVGSAQHRMIQATAKPFNNYTLSVYVKNISGTRQAYIDLGPVTAYFNFVTETIYSALGVASFEDAGSGWYRITLSSQYTPSVVLIGLAKNNNETYAGDGTSAIAFYGAQLNQGSTALPYFATTTRLNLARVDYKDNVNGSLLLEPQRTNLVTYSEDFSNASWTKLRVAVSANIAVSPDGTTNADKIVENTENNSHGVLQSLSNTSGQQYSVSAYVKAAERSWFVIYVGGGPAQGRFFNLSNGTLGSALANTPNASSIVDAGNGWYRCSIVYTATDASSDVTLQTATADGTNIYTGNGTSGIYIYGAQTEASSYATSYIKSEGAATTRLADTCSMTGISDKIGQTEGTMFLDFEIQTTGQDMVVMNIYNETTKVNGMYFYLTSANQLQAYVDNPTPLVTITSGVLAQGRYKAALAYKANDCVFYLNGSLVGTDGSNTIPTCNALRLENYANSPTYQEKTEINQAQLYTTRLSNAELATLTTI